MLIAMKYGALAGRCVHPGTTGSSKGLGIRYRSSEIAFIGPLVSPEDQGIVTLLVTWKRHQKGQWRSAYVVHCACVPESQ